MAKLDLTKYVTVQDRIDYFWEQHADGQIVTELACDPQNNSWVRFKALVYKDRNSVRPDATGYSQEERDYEQATAKSGAKYDTVNSTSWEENCETSAIGRALANMGYATTVDRPSFEEMTKVMRAKVQGNAQVRPQPVATEPDEPREPLKPEERKELIAKIADPKPKQALKDKFTYVVPAEKRATPDGEIVELQPIEPRIVADWSEYTFDEGEQVAIVAEVEGYGIDLAAWRVGIFNATKKKEADPARREGLWAYLMGGAPDVQILEKLLGTCQETGNDTKRVIDAYTDRFRELTTVVPF